MPNIAAIDVGSNAIRLLLVTFNRYGIEKSRRFVRYPLRLGSDVFTNQYILPKTEFKLLEIFSDIALKLKNAKTEHYRAVATSAMRDAKNGADIIKHIYKKTMVRVEIISGQEESTLSRSALLQAVGHVSPLTLLIDLGGGSLEVQQAKQTKGKSLPFGTVRIAAQHPKLCAVIKAAELENETKKICLKIARKIGEKESTPLAIGTGGNLDVLSKLAPNTRTSLPSIEIKKLNTLANKLGKRDIKERQENYRLRSDRADIILPALVIIQALGKIYGLKKILVPGTGLREALLENLSQRHAHERVGNPTQALKNKTKPWTKSGNRLTKLFSQLRPIHHLWGSALELCYFALLYRVEMRQQEPTLISASENMNGDPAYKLTDAQKRDLKYILYKTQPKDTLNIPGPPNHQNRQACKKLAAICALHFWHESQNPLDAPKISFDNQLVIMSFTHRAVPPKHIKTALERTLRRKIKFSYQRSQTSDVT